MKEGNNIGGGFVQKSLEEEKKRQLSAVPFSQPCEGKPGEIAPSSGGKLKCFPPSAEIQAEKSHPTRNKCFRK